MVFLEFIKQFVEGKISATEFYNEVLNNEDFQRYLDSRVQGFPSYLKESGNSLWVYMACLDMNDARDRYDIHVLAQKLLQGVNFVPTDKYQTEFDLMLELGFVLDYIDCPQITDKLISGLPEVSLTQKKKIMRQKLKEIFVYDKKPPMWIQNPEWQLRGDKPMKFRGQFKIDGGYRYEFYDEEGEVSVEQYD